MFNESLSKTAMWYAKNKLGDIKDFIEIDENNIKSKKLFIAAGFKLEKLNDNKTFGYYYFNCK